MGKRIGKKWDLPLEQNGALAVLGIAFLLGGGAGCLFAALSSEAGAQELGEYLTDYLSLAGEAGLSRGLWALIWGQLKYLLAALLLSLTSLGVVGLPILFGVRGFFLSFFQWPASAVCLEGAGCSPHPSSLDCPLSFGQRLCS